MNLLTAYTYIEGEADQGLIKEGFLIADQIREEERQSATSGSAGGGGSSQPDRLESFLIVELARDNFDSAMRFVRSMPDENEKLTTLTGIATEYIIVMVPLVR